MPNPPYSGGIVVIEENQDGFYIRVAHWDDVPQGTPIPKGIAGLDTAMFNAGIDFVAKRNCASRAALKTAFAAYVDAKFPDTP